jgi:hypothetical protein
VAQEDDSPLADLDFRIDQEREQFALYEHRRLGIETQATAVTAAALAVAALLVASRDTLPSGDFISWSLTLAVVSLIWTVTCASAARFCAWPTLRRLNDSGVGRRVLRAVRWTEQDSGLDLDERVGCTLDALRAAPEADSLGLRQRALAHWRARAQSAFRLGEWKWGFLLRGLWGLAAPFAYIVAVAVAGVIEETECWEEIAVGVALLAGLALFGALIARLKRRRRRRGPTRPPSAQS